MPRAPRLGECRIGVQLLGLRNIGNGKRSPGGANSQTFAAESPLDDCGTPLLARSSTAGNQQIVTAATIKTSNAKFLRENIFLRVSRVSQLRRNFESLLELRAATLPPFLLDAEPMPGYSALPHSEASGEQPREIPILRRRCSPACNSAKPRLLCASAKLGSRRTSSRKTLVAPP